MDTFVDNLKKGFKGDIRFDDATLKTYSHDASLFEIKPKLVVSPKDVEDLKFLVATVNTENAAGKKYYLTARSGGTDMTGGPLGESIIVEFTQYFNHIKEVGDTYAVTEPGVYYRDFDKETLKKGLILPSYPASRDLCTVGGMVANNSGGEKNLQYGKTERYVEHIKMIARDGNEYTFGPLTLPQLEAKKQLQTFEGDIYRKMSELILKNDTKIKAARPKVSKNSAGYYLWNVYNQEKGTFDLSKMIVGSQGTLGLMTEAKLGLVKPKQYSKLLIIFLKDMHGLGDMTNKLLSYKPESIESYDDHTFKLAVKLFPEMLKKLKGNAIMLGLRFIPEFWAVVTGGIPKLVILAEFTGDTPEAAHEQVVKAQEGMKEFNVKTKLADSPEEVGKYWTIRRESFSMLRKHIKKLRTAPFIDDFVVNPEYLPEFLPKLYAILDEYPHITYTVAGHVGDGNFHIIPLMDFSKPDLKPTIMKLMEEVNGLVLSYKGSITGEHNDGIIRTPYVRDMYGDTIYSLFEDVKQIFDPDNIFNPGKKVGGTWEYALSHIIKE